MRQALTGVRTPQSELAGLAFDSLQQVFRKIDIEFAFDTAPLPMELDQTVWVVVDPAAGGPSSDFAVLSMCRARGCVTVIGHGVACVRVRAGWRGERVYYKGVAVYESR